MPDQIQNNPFNRPPRIQQSFHPIEIELPAPPSRPEEEKQNLLQTLLPMSSFLVMGVFYAIMFQGSNSGTAWVYTVMMIALAGFTAVTSLITTSIQKHKQQQAWIKSIRDYHRTLDKKEARLLAARQLQLDFLENRFVSPGQLLQSVQNLEITLWEKRPEDADFLSFRIGRGDIDSTVTIRCPDPDINNEEIRRAIAINSEYRKIRNAPVAVDLRSCGSIAIVGRRSLSLSLSRAILSQVVARNSPEDVKLFLFSSEGCYQTWQWLRWLPHTSQSQISGQPEYLAFTRRANKRLISLLAQITDNNRQTTTDGSEKQISGPSLVVVLDKEIDIREEPIFPQLIKNGSSFNVFSIILCDVLEDVPSDCQGIISIQNDGFTFTSVGSENKIQKGKLDSLSLIAAENLSHRLLPISIRTQGLNTRIPSSVNLLQAYQAGNLDDLKIIERWQRIPSKKGVLPFPVQLGSETFATPFTIQLAENLDGPHGLIAGTTGSGKSELIQTLVASLALEHHPYFVSFLLIDFKGGSTFSVFEKLPHVVGMVSNLDSSTASRALEAIKAEIIHREKFLNLHNAKDINDYHKKVSELGGITKDWEPLPHLFIIVDEFAQMAQEMPDFLPQIVAIGRLGRSLGIHLVLATQRPAGVVNDEMRANLNFRICLRVQSIDDSRDMLLRPDAAFLPHNLPGRAYFQLGDGGSPRQFQVARSATEMASEEDNLDHLYRLDYEQPVEIISQSESEHHNPTISSLLSEKICQLYKEKYLDNGYEKLSPILLVPLPEKISIESIDQKNNFLWFSKSKADSSKPSTIEFNIPVGILDSLSTKTQPPQWIDFFNFGGHVMAVGGPQSGKTSFLQSIVYSLTSRYTPAEVNIYALSFAGRDLEIFERLPHVGRVVNGGDSERFHRLISFLQSQIEIRKNKFGETQSQDLIGFNNCVQQDQRLPFICVLVDNFGEFRNSDYVDELNEIEKIIQIGRIYGLYFIITALQANDIPYRIANLIQQRFAFNLADHTEYMTIVGRPDSLDFEVLPKGRCFVSGSTPPMLCQIGNPPDKERWQEIIGQAQKAWGERNKPKDIGILKQLVYLSDLVQNDPGSQDLTKVTIGIDGDSLENYALSLSLDNPHYLIGGPPQSGRTSLLQTIVLKAANQIAPEQLGIVLIDGSGKSLTKLRELPHVIDWVKEEDGLTKNIANLESELEYRRNQQQKAVYPHLLFIFDDYDQLTEAISIGDDILFKLSKHIRQDSDLDFHFIITVSPEFLNGNDPLIKQIKLMRSGISLSSVDTLEAMGGHVTSAMRSQSLVQGRGYLLSRSGNHLVQFADPDSLAFQLVLDKWKKHPRTKWLHPANDDEIKLVREESAPVMNRERARKEPRISSFIDQEATLKKYIEQQSRQKKGAI